MSLLDRQTNNDPGLLHHTGTDKQVPSFTDDDHNNDDNEDHDDDPFTTAMVSTLTTATSCGRSAISAFGPPEYMVSTDDDPLLELPQITRQMSKGLTGETYYDYDLPLNRDDPITILHFNDVYNIQPLVVSGGESQGGISRFITALRTNAGEHPLTLFSGDVFNPSLMSTHTRGRHMVPFLNMLRIHTAVFGNHDFDFGIDHLEYLAGSTRFPWLLSNVFDSEKGEPLANAATYRLFEWQGTRVGIIGLVEFEWLKTLATIDVEDVEYRDFVTEANKLSALLRSKEAELIIALTHMRAANDEKLAREANDIDLVLGGHDHEYYGVKRIGKTVVAKSGSDFREFSKLVIYPGKLVAEFTPVDYDPDLPPTNSIILTPGDREGGTLFMPNFRRGSTIEWECVSVDPDLYQPNKHVDILVGRYNNELLSQMDKIIGEIAVPLETRFSLIRSEETNCGNWFCDLMRKECRAQIAVLNSGTIRSDCIFPVGPLRLRDLTAMLPMLDPLVVVQVTGQQVLQVLENGVSMFPRLEGRFLQVSGIRLEFNPSEPPGKRIIPESVQVLGVHDGTTYEPIQPLETYTLATKEYIAAGKDGFEMLTNCPITQDSEQTPNLPTMVRNALSLAAMANGYKRPHNRLTCRKLTTMKTLADTELQQEFGFLKRQHSKGEEFRYLLNPVCENRIKQRE